ncbi:MAG: methyltransferase domain-containing protein [Candidatus Aminicenantes bacterium]|nr:methyltransferase domain-containing protein [Candidatus Aminicenantes bacterium]NIM77605.1 methyltransferase domain-containing protein [Candidatus Aminicenantes bacterium]NIN16919.1 methyltransferase domain-containing protein [Candidatus Aminicenantes bacterium]NIN40812.1 methyltransferase domain-containing protein [Candidatus Aminicenantes bacterium]NIN83616.1 methyltransferase domain-containing protein [Candidatus Aminicenantes bacterium]
MPGIYLRLMDLVCPLTQSNNIIVEKELKIDTIIRKYRSSYNIDVSKYFHNLDNIKICRCLDSGYRFYHPFNLEGDNEFYELLQRKVKFYYMPWKWEHQKALKYIRSGMRVLEVGCARGDFIDKLSERGAICTGLELNQSAVVESKKKKLCIHQETIQSHSTNYSEHYDIVCSFQVMEHVSDIRSFIESQIRVLKKGGKLIVSVPNNDSPLDLENNQLNQPPHHMGLWNQNSLKNLGMIFKLKLVDIKFEPLQKYHYGWYERSIEEKFNKDNNHYKYKILKFLYFNLRLGKVYVKYLDFFSRMIRGHTIMAVYNK